MGRLEFRELTHQMPNPPQPAESGESDPFLKLVENDPPEKLSQLGIFTAPARASSAPAPAQLQPLRKVCSQELTLSYHFFR